MGRRYSSTTSGGNMSKQAELDRLWSLMLQLDREISLEARRAPRNGGATERYKTLSKDMSKLKLEYEKLKGTGEYNPHKVDHQEAATRKKVMGDFLGRTGPDSHGGL